MERLTLWNEECQCWTYKCPSTSVAAALAAYERTGLTPAEVAEYAKGKAEGRAVVLLCKVGDTVWFRNLTSATITEIVITVDGFTAFWTKDHRNRSEMYFKRDIGETVFLTREEAEKALEERECNV